MAIQVSLLQDSFSHIIPQREKFATAFYFHLFTLYPQVEAMFAHTDMKMQKTMLFSAITLAVNGLNKPDTLVTPLKTLGERHIQYHVKPEHYAMVGEALLMAFAECLGDEWTPELASAWAEVYNTIAHMMCEEV